MHKDKTICFQTSWEIMSFLEKIAAEEGRSVSSVVETVVSKYFKENKSFANFCHNRRRFERKKVDLPALISDSRLQHWEFKTGTTQDISIGGIRFSLPQGINVDALQNVSPTEFSIIFSLPDNLRPINAKCLTRRVYESEEDIQIGAELMHRDFLTFTAIQKYMN